MICNLPSHLVGTWGKRWLIQMNMLVHPFPLLPHALATSMLEFALSVLITLQMP